MRAILGGWVLLACVALAADTALGQQPKRLGVHRDWSAWSVGNDKARECFMHASPTKSEGKYAKRGRTSLAVTRRPADKVAAEVSVTAGYTYREKSEVKLLVDDQVFRLFTDRDMAFAPDAKTDATLVRAMKKGTRLTVQGVSARGTTTVDRYSLAGFTAAYRAISRTCPVRR